jgi:hypothetical protein
MDDCTLARSRIMFVFAQMLDCTDGNARAKEELLLGKGNLRAIPLEIGPIR